MIACRSLRHDYVWRAVGRRSRPGREVSSVRRPRREHQPRGARRREPRPRQSPVAAYTGALVRSVAPHRSRHTQRPAPHADPPPVLANDSALPRPPIPPDHHDVDVHARSPSSACFSGLCARVAALVARPVRRHFLDQCSSRPWRVDVPVQPCLRLVAFWPARSAGAVAAPSSMLRSAGQRRLLNSRLGGFLPA